MTNPNLPEPEPVFAPQLAELESAVRAAAKEASFPRAALAQSARVFARNDAAQESAAVAADALGVQAWREEVTVDLLELLRQIQSLAARQSQLQTCLDALAHEVRSASAATQREAAQLRSELLSHRRGMAVHSLFESLLGPWERLRIMSDALSRAPAVDSGELDETSRAAVNAEALQNQLRAIVTILGRALRDLGFEEFTASEGQPFDPHRMICSGYLEGPPGVVLKCVKPGFCAGDVVVSPATVLIADPQAPSTSTQPLGESK